MSRQSVLLAALTSRPASTSELYDRIGYAALTRMGLIPYDAFRSELARLDADGLARSGVGRNGATLWWRGESTGQSGPVEPGRRDH
jgi:hypothetical protein